MIRFLAADFSSGLPQWEGGRFDGIVSGLALQYAQSYDEAKNEWTRDAYVRILAEARRLLRPGGQFVFSVNVPEPAWGRVAWVALAGTLQARRPLHFLKRSLRIYRYGNWLKREARRGRFHYLPQGEIEAMLTATSPQALRPELVDAYRVAMTRVSADDWNALRRRTDAACDLARRAFVDDDRAAWEVVQVAEDSPADRAGLRPEDLIVEVDGVSVSAVDDLQRLMAGDAIGRPVTTRLLRQGRELTVEVVPDELVA